MKQRLSFITALLGLTAASWSAPLAAAPPSNQEQRVWLAVSRHVQADEATEAFRKGRLPILARTSFPSSEHALSHLEQRADQGFCDLSGEQARSIWSRLREVNEEPGEVGASFARLPQFELVEDRPIDGNYLGLSRVLFTDDRRVAWLSVDISGLTGVIMQLRREGDEWRMTRDCVGWSMH